MGRKFSKSPDPTKRVVGFRYGMAVLTCGHLVPDEDETLLAAPCLECREHRKDSHRGPRIPEPTARDVVHKVFDLN
jgi:hypothetical protein